MLQDNAPDAVKLSRREAAVGSQGEWIDPELASRALPARVDVHGLSAIETVEEKAIGPGDSLNGRHWLA